MTSLLIVMCLLADSSLGGEGPARHCGPAGVATLARECGVACDTSEVETRLRELFPKCDLAALSIKELRQALEDLGIPATAGHVNRNAISDLPRPFLAFFTAERLRRDVGHVVVVTKLENGMICVVDETSSAEPIWMPVANFVETWDGHFVSVRGRLLLSGVSSLLLLLILSGLAALLVVSGAQAVRRIRRNKGEVARGAGIAVLVAFTMGGCGGQSEVVSISPVSKDFGLIELDKVQAGIKFQQAFRVCSPTAGLSIVSIDPTCDCSVASHGSLPQGISKDGFQFMLEIRPENVKGRLRGGALLTFSPELPSPSYVSASAVVVPKAIAQYKRHSRVPIADTLTFRYTVFKYRHELQALAPIEAVSDSGGRFELVRSHCELSAVDENDVDIRMLACDKHTVECCWKAPAIGTFPSEIVTTFSDGVKVRCPIHITVRHPFELPRVLYMGRFKQGEKCVAHFNVDLDDSLDASAIALRCPHEDVHVEFGNKVLSLEVRNQLSGRFAFPVEVDCGGKAPALRLEVSGHVD